MSNSDNSELDESLFVNNSDSGSDSDSGFDSDSV